MSTNKYKNIAELFDAAGNAMQIAMDLKKRERAVYAWRSRGIPLIHWQYFSKKAQTTVEHIFNLHEKIRGRR